MLKPLVKRISKTTYVRSAIADRADLSVFKHKPTQRVIWGLVVIAISYVIGWPAITVLGVVAACTKEPLILLVGGPLAYGLSHLVFILGAYLSGAQYAAVFFRWATRVTVEKLMGATSEIAPDRGDKCPPP